ncbi:hypothetical protein ACFXC7_13315 [Streptomyces virginiae]|uniref:hypothetical protein n=1 Tax=Streptomyces virginiae TaxID=1961 RepID=UPI0036C3B95B
MVPAGGGHDNQTRTLLLDLDGPATVSYSLVRGPGGRLGDAEITARTGDDPRLDKVVSNLVAGSGADQSSQLSAYAVRFVMFRPGGPEDIRRVLDATPGLSRRHQQDGTALWGVEPWLPRAVIVSAKQGEAPIPVAAGPVEAHGKIPAGEAGRVLRIADRADAGWQATLDGKPLKAKTLDGWAQGFELPTGGGRLDLVHEDSLLRTAWNWTQGLLALVLLVMALPGRRAQLDDDLPEEEAAPTSRPGPGEAGEGRRARRLRAEAEADAAPGPVETAAAADPYAQIPAQPVYGEESYAYQAYDDQGGYAYEPQQPQQPQQQYPYEQQYTGYDQQQQGGVAYETPYPQQQQHQPVHDQDGQHYPYPYEPYEPYPPHDVHAQHDPRPDGSPQQ